MPVPLTLWSVAVYRWSLRRTLLWLVSLTHCPIDRDLVFWTRARHLLHKSLISLSVAALQWEILPREQVENSLDSQIRSFHGQDHHQHPFVWMFFASCLSGIGVQLKREILILSGIIMRSGTMRKIATNGTRIREDSQESGWEGNLKLGLKANL